MDSSSRYVVVIGGANVDFYGIPDVPLHWGDSNPGRTRMTPGGVGRNIAEHLARTGIDTKLICAIGDDSLGRVLMEHTARFGVDVSHVVSTPHSETSIYLSILYSDGELAVAVSSMEAAGAIDADCITANADLIANAGIVAIDANLQESTIAAISKVVSDSTIVVADPVSTTKTPRLAPIFGRLDVITPNLAEAGALDALIAAGRHSELEIDAPIPDAAPSSATDAAALAARLCPHVAGEVYITLGADGVWFENGTERGHVPASVSKESGAVSGTVSGAGDAFTAGLIYGISEGRSMRERTNLALCAAALSLASGQPIHRDLSAEYLEAMIKRENAPH